MLAAMLSGGCGGAKPPAPAAVAAKSAQAKPPKPVESPKPANAKANREPAAEDKAKSNPTPLDPPKQPAAPAGDAANAESAAAPVKKDPRDNSVERILLCTSAGPLAVELKLSIDGQPYRAQREELVDDLLELADRDHDGRPTWDEVYADPKHVFARRLQLQKEQMDRRQFMKTYDTNQNGVVDRAEARRFVSRSNNAGQSFTIDGSSRYRETNARHSLVRSLLDADGDESLSAAELVEAETRLRLRDANDDGIVSLAELDDTLAGDSQAMMTAMQYRNSPAAMRLGPLGDWDGVVFTLAELYLRHGELPAEGFPLTPKLAAELDADGNGALNREELQRLDKI
ncbi:MAG TPA: hypothetical protein VGN42_26435, partial [Pirellulales bacterium]|nr:hypothetical protein [Pirellulales bacterium]